MSQPALAANLEPTDLAGELIERARAAHHAATGAQPEDDSYLLGERNGYAHAAALILTHGTRGIRVPAGAVADRIIEDLADGITDLPELRRRATSLPQAAQVAAADIPPQAWIEPITFTRRYAGHGADEDFGTSWGPHRNQRISHRHRLGADEGLLYVYDPTWREYAVLDPKLSLRAARAAFAQALVTDPGMPVRTFAALVQSHCLTAPIQTAPGVEL